MATSKSTAVAKKASNSIVSIQEQLKAQAAAAASKIAPAGGNKIRYSKGKFVLLVVGAKGRGSLKDLFVGSVASRLTELSTVPLLLVK